MKHTPFLLALFLSVPWSLAGAQVLATHEIHDDQTSFYGWSSVGLGDVDADGVEDLAVGAAPEVFEMVVVQLLALDERRPDSLLEDALHHVQEHQRHRDDPEAARTEEGRDDEREDRREATLAPCHRRRPRERPPQRRKRRLRSWLLVVVRHRRQAVESWAGYPRSQERRLPQTGRQELPRPAVRSRRARTPTPNQSKPSPSGRLRGGQCLRMSVALPV